MTRPLYRSNCFLLLDPLYSAARKTRSVVCLCCGEDLQAFRSGELESLPRRRAAYVSLPPKTLARHWTGRQD